MKVLPISLVLAFATALTLATPTVAGDFPDLDLSTAVSAGGVVLITPAGTGPTLAEVGATVTVTLLDSAGLPWPGYPAERVWIGACEFHEESNAAFCPQGNIADGSTDASGLTTISGRIFGGGWCESSAIYIYPGMPLTQPPLAIAFNSPDINGDLIVNLNDFALFGADYNTDAFRSDLVPNGVVDLADFSRFGQSYNESCP